MVPSQKICHVKIVLDCLCYVPLTLQVHGNLSDICSVYRIGLQTCLLVLWIAQSVLQNSLVVRVSVKDTCFVRNKLRWSRITATADVYNGECRHMHLLKQSAGVAKMHACVKLVLAVSWRNSLALQCVRVRVQCAVSFAEMCQYNILIELISNRNQTVPILYCCCMLPSDHPVTMRGASSALRLCETSSYYSSTAGCCVHTYYMKRNGVLFIAVCD